MNPWGFITGIFTAWPQRCTRWKMILVHHLWKKFSHTMKKGKNFIFRLQEPQKWVKVQFAILDLLCGTLCSPKMWKIVQVWIFSRIALNLGFLIAASVDCATIITTIVHVTYVLTKTLLLLWPGSLFNIRDGFLSLLVMLIVMLFSFFYYVAAFRRILDFSCFVYCLTLCDTSWGSYSSPTSVLSFADPPTTTASIFFVPKGSYEFASLFVLTLNFSYCFL